MFFKNIAKWSKKVMWGVTILCYILYFCLVVLAPTITIMVKYDIFGSDSTAMRKVTGFGIIVIVVCGIAAYCFMKKAISRLPKISVTEQRFRFGIECILDALPLGILIFAMFAVKDDVALAFDTLMICMWFFVAGVVFNNLFIKFLDAEWEIRSGAKFDKEKEKRKDVI